LPEHPRAWDRVALRLINDPRDLPFVHLMIACSITALLGLSLYPISRALLPGPSFWLVAGVYLLIWAFWTLDRFILMLHCTSHRILFRREHGWLNHVIPVVLGPFFGETPQTYFCHHMGMHHPENNLADDLSSTMPFQRDRFGHWLAYYLRFLALVMLELPLYFVRRKQNKMALRVLIGEGSFWLVIGLLAAFVDWRATLAVFVIPVLMVRTLMMAGNWAQHAFVDPAHPADPYRNSITCIDSRYNRRCFNDGYHIHHHVKPRCHWSELPGEFETNRTLYGEKDAVVFRGLDFFLVWVLLMTGRYRALAKAFVQLPGAPERSEAEIVEFLHTRLRPIRG
jgi:fatty acid desaturase